MKKKREYVFKKILEIAEQYGKIKDKAIKKFTLFILLSYEEGTPNIKIEINTRLFGSKYENKIYLGITMKVMVIEDIFSHKLVAMYERLGKANRDIFDVWYLLKKNFPINKNIVEKRTNMSFREFVKSCIEKLEKLPDKRRMELQSNNFLQRFCSFTIYKIHILLFVMLLFGPGGRIYNFGHIR